jgi:DNA-binding GntR family transcriptional regulator
MQQKNYFSQADAILGVMGRVSTAGQTATVAVYEQLKADILAGRFAPGQRLKIQELCEGRGVNVNAMREALSRLAGEGLAQAIPRQGFTITPISREHLIDLTAVRVALETTIIQWSVSRGDTAWAASVVAAHYTLENTPMIESADHDQVSDVWMQAHSAFHAALLAGSGSTIGCGIAANLADTAELYRRMSITMGPSDRDIAGEHRALMDAALARDGQLAAERIAAHYNRTAENLLRAMGNLADNTTLTNTAHSNAL